MNDNAILDQAFAELRRSILGQVPPVLAYGKVKAVDAANGTCTVELASAAQLLNVPIRGTQPAGAMGVRVWPKVDSEVLLAYLRHPTYAVILHISQIDQVHIDGPDGFTARLTNDGKLELNGGSLGGLVKVEQLVERLNAIEQRVNELQTGLNTHTHLFTGTGAVGTPPSPVVPSPALDQTNAQMIANPDIAH